MGGRTGCGLGYLRERQVRTGGDHRGGGGGSGGKGMLLVEVDMVEGAWEEVEAVTMEMVVVEEVMEEIAMEETRV